MTVAERIETFLRQAGWTRADLASRAKISPSTVTRLLHGRKEGGDAEPYELGELVAMKLERATVDAYTRGETKVPPLRAVDLLALPSSTNVDADRPSRTGTEG